MKTRRGSRRKRRIVPNLLIFRFKQAFPLILNQQTFRSLGRWCDSVEFRISRQILHKRILVLNDEILDE